MVSRNAVNLKKIEAFFKLIRPAEWTKSFGNMAFASLTAGLIYSIPVFSTENILFFFYGFIAVGPLLWGGLYALNDWTDIEKDKIHPVKKNRPLPSRIISANTGLAIALLFIFFSLIISYSINFLFFSAVLAMLVNQLLYTLPPIKLKEKPVLDLISGSLINPIFRFYCGWLLFVQSFNAPILFLIFILGLQFGGYTLYRLHSKKVEKKLNYKSSVTVFGKKSIRIISYISIAVGLLSYLFITLNSAFFPSLVYLGSLPIEFFYWGAINVLPLPLYWNMLKDPEKADLKKMYNYLYSHYAVFLFGILWLFFNFIA